MGSDVTVQAHVADSSKVLVKTFLGFWIECDFDEANRLINMHKEDLSKKIAAASARVGSQLAHIKIVQRGIQELLGLSDL